MPFAQLRVVRVQPVDLGLAPLVRLLGGGGPLLGGVAGLGEAADLGVCRGRAAAGGGDLSAEPGEALAAVGDGAGDVPQPAFLVRQLPLQFGAVLDGVLQGPARRLQGGGQLRFLFADPGGLAFHVVGVASLAFVLRDLGGALDPRLGQRHRAAHPLRQLRQLVPGLLGALDPWREGAYLRLQCRLPLEGGAQPGLGGLLAFLEGGLVLDLGAQGPAQGDEVVGEQAQPGVAQIGLDDGGAPGDGGLASEGFELAAQFVGQVLDAGEVGLHRVEFPQRLLLALAVFEDAGGLFDESSPAHGVGVQDGVELALADDDMHLAADSGVGKQFLDVEQAAGVAVDLVLAAAVTEHDPGNGDFGVFDGQCAVGIVDGERDLGPAQRGPAGGAGEDDVFHLSAAQGFGALFAHDPGQRVHDIRLAGTVGAHDAGDAGFEAQRRGGGEGLEASQGQTLQVHAVGLYRPLVGGRPQHSAAGVRAAPEPGYGPRVWRPDAPRGSRWCSFSVSPGKVQGTSSGKPCGEGGSAGPKRSQRPKGRGGQTDHGTGPEGRDTAGGRGGAKGRKVRAENSPERGRRRNQRKPTRTSRANRRSESAAPKNRNRKSREILPRGIYWNFPECTGDEAGRFRRLRKIRTWIPQETTTRRTTNDEGTPKRPLQILKSGGASSGWRAARPALGLGSGERGLRLGYVDVQHRVVATCGSRQHVVFGLHPDEFGFKVLDALLKPSHLGEDSGVGAADVTEKRLCHDGWSSTLSDRPKRCGS